MAATAVLIEQYLNNITLSSPSKLWADRRESSAMTSCDIAASC